MPLSKVHLGIGQMNILVYLVILVALGQVTSLVDRFHSSEETPPSFHFAVLDEETGKICILAKFDASFIITYDTKYGKQQMIDRLTAQPEVDGRCPPLLDEQPVMDISWRGGFTFRLIFTKNPFENTWKIETLDLVYNTGDSLFRDSVGGEYQIWLGIFANVLLHQGRKLWPNRKVWLSLLSRQVWTNHIFVQRHQH